MLNQLFIEITVFKCSKSVVTRACADKSYLVTASFTNKTVSTVSDNAILLSTRLCAQIKHLTQGNHSSSPLSSSGVLYCCLQNSHGVCSSCNVVFFFFPALIIFFQQKLITKTQFWKK